MLPMCARRQAPVLYPWRRRHVVNYREALLLQGRVVHGSFFLDPTRPGETLTQPDPRVPIKSLTRPDPTRPDPPLYVLCFTSSTFKLPTGNSIQFLHDFEGNSVKISLQVLKCSPRVQNELEWSYFSRSWSRGNKKIANIRC